MLRSDPRVEVIGLLTTVSAAYERVSMHATRLSVLQAQAREAELPLMVAPLPTPCSNEQYEQAMRTVLDDARQQGVTHVAFGDLFLEDIRAYRVEKLEGSGIEPLFPVWQEPTALLARRMVDAGLQAVVTCIDPKTLPASFAGRAFDHSFLDALPPGVDPCGENGEFHTCVLAGPMFRHRIHAQVGEIVEREGFCFADVELVPGPSEI